MPSTGGQAEDDALSLEQWKVLVDLADRRIQRNDQFNRFVVGLISALVTFTLLEDGFSLFDGLFEISIFLLASSGAILTLWALELNRFYDVLGEKYNQILELEVRLGTGEFGIRSEILRRGSYRDGVYRFHLHSRLMPSIPLVVPFAATLVLLTYAVLSSE